MNSHPRRYIQTYKHTFIKYACTPVEGNFRRETCCLAQFVAVNFYVDTDCLIRRLVIIVRLCYCENYNIR